MTKSRPAFSAFLVACLGLAAWAGPEKTADVSAAGPSAAPTAPTPSSPLPNPGSAPSLSAPPGSDISTPQTQAPEESASAAPAGAAAPSSPQAAAAPAQQAAAAQSGAQAPGSGAPPDVRRQLDSTVSQLNAGSAQGAAAGAANAAVVFRRIYDDESRASAARTEGSGAVAGRDEGVVNRVGQIASLAQAASPYDAPKLYQDALDQTSQAAEKGRLGIGLTRKLVRALLGFAAPQGRQAVPRLAQAAAQAPRPADAARALKAIGEWDRLFDHFGKTAPRRDEQTRALIAIAKDRLRAGGVPPAGERPAAAPSAVSAVASVPPLRLRDASADAAIPELSPTWLDDVLAAHSRNPGTDPWLLYQIARRGAGRVVPAAAASAVGQSAQAWLFEAWQWLRQFYLRHFGPQAVVDLGGGLSARGPASEVSGLAALKRAPTADESKAAGGDWRVAVVALDLSRVNRPYLKAMRELDAGAPMTADRLQDVLAQGRALAEAASRLTGDASGREVYRRLERRWAGQSELSSVDARLLGYWLDTLRQAALARVEGPAEEAARRGGPVVLSDLSENGLLIVAAPKAQGEALRRLGFEVWPRQDLVLARLGLGGLDAAQRREALAAAVSAAAGRDASFLSGGSARRDALALMAFIRTHAAQAKAAAAQVEAEAPFIARRFETLGLVEAPSGRYVLARSRRVLAGQVETIDLLRGESSGRAAFARKTLAPLPR